MSVDFNGSRTSGFWAPVFLGLNVDLPSLPLNIRPSQMGHLAFTHTRKDQELNHRTNSRLRSGENRAHLILREEIRILDRHLQPLDLWHIREVPELNPELEDAGEDL